MKASHPHECPYSCTHCDKAYNTHNEWYIVQSLSNVNCAPTLLRRSTRWSSMQLYILGLGGAFMFGEAFVPCHIGHSFFLFCQYGCVSLVPWGMVKCFFLLTHISKVFKLFIMLINGKSIVLLKSYLLYLFFCSNKLFITMSMPGWPAFVLSLLFKLVIT